MTVGTSLRTNKDDTLPPEKKNVLGITNQNLLINH